MRPGVGQRQYEPTPQQGENSYAAGLLSLESGHSIKTECHKSSNLEDTRKNIY